MTVLSFYFYIFSYVLIDLLYFWKFSYSTSMNVFHQQTSHILTYASGVCQSDCKICCIDDQKNIFSACVNKCRESNHFFLNNISFDVGGSIAMKGGR